MSIIEKANRVAIKKLASKTAITLSHQFADITARDAYFVLNPTELVDNLFIKVGTGYQQYLSSIWEDVSAVVIEQLTAAVQTLVDAGGYYTAKNVEGALQEVGEQINDLDAEVTDAHNSIIKNKNFTSLKDRFEENESDLAEHKLDYEELVTKVSGKANKVQEDWITPTLLNGTTGILKYRLNSIGLLEVQADINILNYGATIFTFPAEYRPNTSIIDVISRGGLVSNTGKLLIGTSGVLQIHGVADRYNIDKVYRLK